jgi:hypothetical protein
MLSVEIKNPPVTGLKSKFKNPVYLERLKKRFVKVRIKLANMVQ